MFSRLGLMLASLVVVTSAAAGQGSGSNGVYGGYVGSDRWFAVTRQSATNMALLQRLGGGVPGRLVPPDYIEVAAQFAFPSGNPFPNGRLPDLRINCVQQNADPVERAPSITQTDGGSPEFYTVLKTGQSYAFSWMYYFGTRERFETWHVPADAPKQVRLSLYIDSEGHGRIEQTGTAAPPRQGSGVEGAGSPFDPAPAGSSRPSASPYPPIPTSPPGSPAAGEHPGVPSAPPGTPAGAPTSSVPFTGNPDEFDLTGFPPQPTNFEEQQIMEEINVARDPMHNPGAVTKGRAHERLAKYYQRKGDTQRASIEFQKAKFWYSGGQPAGGTDPISGPPSSPGAGPVYPNPAYPPSNPPLPDPNLPSLPYPAPGQPTASSPEAGRPPAQSSSVADRMAGILNSLPAQRNLAGSGPEPPSISQTNPDQFDLSGFPVRPSTMEEQQIAEFIRTARTAGEKAMAHEKLALYYERKGDAQRARGERLKAQYWRNSV